MKVYLRDSELRHIMDCFYMDDDKISIIVQCKEIEIDYKEYEIISSKMFVQDSGQDVFLDLFVKEIKE